MVPSFDSLIHFYTQIFNNDQKPSFRSLKSSQNDGRLLNPFTKQKQAVAATKSILEDRILIVDDDTMNVMGLEEIIKANHGDVIIDKAYSGQEALDLVILGLNKGHIYRLVFMDL